MDEAKRARYCFVGRQVEMGDKRLDMVGQVLVLSEVEYAGLIKKVPLIREEDFKKIFTDPLELAKWGHNSKRAMIPPSFAVRLETALDIVRAVHRA